MDDAALDRVATRAHARTWTLAACVVVALTARVDAAPAAREASCVVRVEVAAVITGGVADYVGEGVRAAETGGCALLLVLDTPGGALDATRRIVQRFLAARTPIITYVAPSGARAGSAGMFLTIAAHVAGMAPSTTIGAAHPVVGMGKDPEEAGGEHLAQKIENDTAALARSIAQRRGRNATWAESAVRASVSATATEALNEHVIDHVAADERALLAMIDGRVIETAAGPVVLATRGASVTDHAMSLGQKVRSVVGDPNVVYLLFLVGVIGLVIEMTSPGLIVPGAIGGVAFLLAVIGMDVLPVKAGAVVLMVLGAGLVAIEAFVTAYGLVALGGVVMLGLGAALLIDHDTAEFFADATLGVSWQMVLPVAVAVAAVALGLAWRAREVRRRGAVTGLETLRGDVAKVVAPIGDAPGQIFLHGERWQAIADHPVPVGTSVRVDDVHGLTVHVTPVTDHQHGPAGGMR